MDISVVLATYKRPELLDITLKSFSQMGNDDLKWDLWIVDNAGDPETESVVKSWQDELPLHYLIETKTGKNNALNRAIPEVQGQLVVFTDDDIIASTDWLMQMWEGLQRWPDHYVFGGKITAEWFGKVPFWGVEHPLNLSLFALHSPSEVERPYFDDFLPFGPNMAVKRTIFNKGFRFNPNVGPTNSSIYLMGSETEFLKRLKNAGFLPVFLPRAVVKHQIRADQLSDSWLDKRNFRIGMRYSSQEKNLDKAMLSCQRFLWKQLAICISEQYYYKAIGDKIKIFETQCKLWRLRGRIYGERRFHGVKEKSLIQKIISCSK